jgi:hypothetical protein
MKKILFFSLLLLNCAAFSQETERTITLIFRESFDHGVLDNVLHKYVKDGLVDYRSIRDDPEFRLYISRLKEVDPDKLIEADSVRLAYWINVYNAFTIKIVVDNYPVESIRDIGNGKNPWSLKIVELGGGKVYSLDEVENEIIRKRFNEPRIHFALVCAAIGCPMLRSEAYVPERLNEQLDESARIFLTNSFKNRLDKANKKLYLSSIFDWYADDFKKKFGSVSAFLERYFDSDDKAFLKSKKYKIQYLEYDWSLNEQKQ